MGNGFQINEKDWGELTERQKSWLLFNSILEINSRLSALEKKPFIDKLSSFTGGIIGGIVAFFSAKIF